jgi:hypothetical protein
LRTQKSAGPFLPNLNGRFEWSFVFSCHRRWKQFHGRIFAQEMIESLFKRISISAVQILFAIGSGRFSMASQWHSLVSQKIFLARTLLAQRDQSETVPGQEACWQGAVELALRSRQLLLVMIARMYQEKTSEPDSLDGLRSLLGDQIPEIAELEALASGGANWWVYLGELERYQTRPPVAKKTVSDENIIAIAADTGPDRTSKTLNGALTELKQFTDALEDRHSEW